jgi:hypothetical protein
MNKFRTPTSSLFAVDFKVKSQIERGRLMNFGRTPTSSFYGIPYHEFGLDLY